MRKKLTEIARIVVEKKGVEAVSMRDLAKKAGVSAMASYRHFSGKDELLLEVAARGFELLTHEGNQAAAAHRDPRRRLEAVLYAYYSFGQRHRYLFDLMFGPLKKEEKRSANFQKSAKASFAQFSQYVAEFVPGPDAAASIWSFIHGMTVLSSNGYLAATEANARDAEKKVRIQISDLLERMKS